MDIKNYKLVIPDETYEKQYTAMMDKWESIGLYDKCGFSIVGKSKAEITMCKEV